MNNNKSNLVFNKILGLVLTSYILSFSIHNQVDIKHSQIIINVTSFLDWNKILEWFMGLSKNYNVNPYIFGAIYIGAIPFFTLSLARLIKNLKNKKPAYLSAFSTGFFFISAYLYLIVVGKNVPFWVYSFIAIMIILGILSILKKIKAGVSINEKI